MATDPHEHLLTAAEFLRIDFGPDLKAELDNGVIRMMAGGSSEHARVQTNIAAYLRVVLRGSDCRPFGSDMAVGTHNFSVRYPDVSVVCSRSDPANDKLRSFDDPRIVFEVLSPSTRHLDFGVKLEEYRAIASVDTIVFVDPASEHVRVLQRKSPTRWHDDTYITPRDVELPSLGVTIPHAEIFARD